MLVQPGEANPNPNPNPNPNLNPNPSPSPSPNPNPNRKQVNLALQMLWFVKIAKGLLAVLSRCHADGLRDRELLVTREELEYEAVAKRDGEGESM